MLKRNIIVVGASAGGVEALTQLIPAIPSDLPAAIFVVVHIPSQSYSVLPKILNRAIKKRQEHSLLEALHPKDGEAIEHGRVYIAPPDKHLLVKDGYIRLARGPQENGHRPAVDPLFRTAARTYGQRVVGIVLSGTLDDGTAGLAAIKQRGGVTIAQNPDEALYTGMPSSAIENVEVDYILPVSDIASVLVELVYKPVKEEGAEPVSSDMDMEADMAELELGAMQSADRPGTPSPYACPDCHGVLWELVDGQLIRFRCRTGHAYSVETLLAKQSEALEDALWQALRALEEKAALVQRMGIRARDRNQQISAKRFEEQGQFAQQQATLIRQMLLKEGSNGNLSTVNGKVVDTQNLLSATEEKLQFKSQVPRLLPGNLARSTVDLPFPVLAICASTGGLNAISQVLSALPADFPAAITIVQHPYPEHPSKMVEILNSCTALQVKQAEQGDVLRPGTVYIAPMNQHLLVNPDSTVCLSSSELVHFVCPSAELLLESVAASFKQRAIALVLTGKGSDGAMGVQAIKQMGGTIIAQDQTTSEFFGMPEAAINTGYVDFVVPLNEIAATLVSLVKTKNK